MLTFKKLLTYLFFIVTSYGLYAQENIINAIRIDIQDVQSVSQEMVQSHIKLKPGAHYESTLADQSIRSLHQTGLFDYIKVSIQEVDSQHINVIFQILPKYKVSSIQIEGNKALNTQKLLKELKIKVGDPLDEAIIKSSADKLNDLYEKKGYYQTYVSYTIEKDSASGLGQIIYKVEEKSKQKITEVKFAGNQKIDSHTLQRLIRTTRWNILSFLTSNGYLRETILHNDIETIKDHYKNLGFLDIEINHNQVEITNPHPGKASVLIHIHEGTQYYVGNIQISGNTLYSKDALTKYIHLKPNGILSAGIVDNDIEALKDYYGQFGYLDTYIVADRKINLSTNKIDVTYQVHESEKFYVENILIQGNAISKSTIIARELALAPGDTFDLVRMKNSEARLRNTGFFNQVNVTSEEIDIPNRRNLKISVKEAKTTHIAFGGGFSSLEHFGVFTELTQGNFDARNPKTYFRGAGQKFRVRLGLSQKSNEIILGFEEPWVCQRELAIGTELYRTQNTYMSDFYKQSRIGMEVYMRKWFFDSIEGKIYYSASQTDIGDMPSSAPIYLQEEKGKQTVCKLGLTLTYDTRDNLIMPREGTRIEAITEVAGGPAGGPTKFVRVEGRGGHWIPTFDTLEQSLGFYGRTGTVTTFGGKRLPLFEHYFLGGADNLRGYEHRKASPRFQDGEPSGGRTFAFAGAEYAFRLLEPLHFVTFYDWGFVNKNTNDISLKNFQHDMGLGFRIFIMGAPLRLDLAFPLKEKSYGYKNKSPVFNWSFGTSF